MPPLTLDFSPNADLTGISLAVKNSNYIADIVLPRTGVKHETYEYKEYPIEAFLGVHKTEVGKIGTPETVSVKGEYKASKVKGHSLLGEVPISDIIDAQGTEDDPLGDETEVVTEAILVAREKRVADIFNNASNFGGSITLSGSSKFSDPSSKAALTIGEAINSMVMPANTGITSRAGALALCSHPDFLVSYNTNGSERGIASLEHVAQVLGLDKIIVGQSRINIAKPGQEPNIVNAWQNNLVLVYINPNAKPKRGLTFGLTPQFEQRKTEDFTDKKPGTDGVQYIKVSEKLEELVLARSCGYLIKNIV